MTISKKEVQEFFNLLANLSHSIRLISHGDLSGDNCHPAGLEGLAMELKESSGNIADGLNNIASSIQNLADAIEEKK